MELKEKLKNTLRLKFYSLLNSPLSNIIIKFLSVKVDNIKKQKNPKGNFFIAITIDTEPGYLEKNGKRIWHSIEENAFQGYYYGIKNWREVAEKNNIKLNFFLDTHCFSAKGDKYKKILAELNKVKKNHEIGFHLHPNHDSTLKKYLKKEFEYNNSDYYDLNTNIDMLKAGKFLIKKYLGINIKSFRWGVFGLGNKGIKALKENKYQIDSSACPGLISYTKGKKRYGWSKVKISYPWILNEQNYQNINGKSGVLEIPITTFKILSFRFLSDPAFGKLLFKVFKYLYKNAKRPFVFVIISHSLEGCYRNGEITNEIKNIDKFIKYTKNFKDVRFTTLEGCKKNFI